MSQDYGWRCWLDPQHSEMQSSDQAACAAHQMSSNPVMRVHRLNAPKRCKCGEYGECEGCEGRVDGGHPMALKDD